jgi:hypothetical protein
MNLISQLFAGKTTKNADPARPIALYFEDGCAAFAYACKYVESPLEMGRRLPAIVMEATRGVDGNQTALLRVAAPDGGFYVAASTAGPDGPTLDVGHFVVWEAMRYVPAVTCAEQDKRRGWVGLILGTLRPEYREGAWVGAIRFC